MKINISIIIILMLNPLIIGNDEANAEKENERYNQAIIKVLPEEFKNYKKQLKGDNKLNDAKVSLSLISKTQDLILKSTYNTDPNKQEEYNKAYIATWRLCTVMMRKTTDSEAKKLILERWNSSIKKDDRSVPFQIYAIAYGGWDPNRSFLTNDFWKLLKNTKRKKTISAISFVLYQHGNKEDADILMKKRKSGIDVELQEIIQNAINWMNYRLTGDKTNPGPAAAPPKMNTKGDVENPDAHLKEENNS